MKGFNTGDVVYIETENLTAVIKNSNEYATLIEFIHRYNRRTYSTVHATGWMYAHAFKIDI